MTPVLYPERLSSTEACDMPTILLSIIVCHECTKCRQSLMMPLEGMPSLLLC